MQSRFAFAYACSCAVLAFAIQPTSALAEVSWGANIGAGHSDNIRRTSTDEKEESIALAGFDLGLNHDGNRLDAELSSRLQYLDYLDDTFDSEVVGTAIGRATLEMVRERLTWTVEDTFGQSVTNQLEAAGPGNRENVNYFTTGPDLRLPLTSRTDFLVNGRYTDVHYEESNLDNNRLSGGAALLRHISEQSAISLNALTEQVEYDEDELYQEFDRNEAFLRYQLDGARTAIAVDVGATEIKQEDRSSDGTLVRLSASRRVSPASTLYLDGGREFSDAGQIFRQLQEDRLPGQGTTGPVQPASDPFTSTYGTLRWSYQRHRTGLDLFASRFSERYEIQQIQDRDRDQYGLSFSRQASEFTGLYASAVYEDSDYFRINRTVSRWAGEVSASWRLSRRTFLSLQYVYSDQNDDVVAEEYTENQIWLILGIVGGSREGAPQMPRAIVGL